jgi:hypothetical protein
LLFHKLPPPLNYVQVGRVRWSGQQRDAKRGSDGLDQGTTLVARLVQAQGERPWQPQSPQLPPSLADTLRIAVWEVSDGDPLMWDGMERAEPMDTLPPAGRFDPPPGAAPEIPQKRAEDQMRRIHKKDGPLPRVGVGEAWLHLFFDPLPAQRGRLGLAGSRPCDGGARGERATGGPALACVGGP